MGKAWNGTFIVSRYNGPFYHHFCTKTGKLVFQFATRLEWRRYPKLTVVCIDLLSILALLTACQEYLVTLK